MQLVVPTVLSHCIAFASTMKILLIICCAVATDFVYSDQIYTDLANLCSNNGMVYLSLTTTGEQSLLQNKALKAYMAFQKQGLRVRRLGYGKLKTELKFELDTLILLSQTKTLSQPHTFQMYLEDIGNHKIRKTILMFVDHFDSNQELELNNSLNNLVIGNAWFIVMYQNKSNVTKYRNIISLQNNTKTLVQDIKLTKSNQIVQTHNLEGLKLYSNTLSWAPYFDISHCKEMHNDDFKKFCEMSGYLNDFMNAMGNIANFTWTSHVPIDGSWGTMNENGVWVTGPMGTVIKGEYHMSISSWSWTIDRDDLMDFVSVGGNEFFVLARTPQPAKVDFGLFIRPFQDDAWLLVLASFIMIVIIIAVPYSFLSYYEQTEGFKLASLFSWLFFLLINAYYGGALTMFFISELELPFNSIEDVLRSFPDWNLKMAVGNDIFYKVKAEAGDPLYSEFWKRVINEPDEHVFQNLEEGLSMLKNERAVIHVGEGTLKSYFKNNPYHQQNLKVFAKGQPQPAGLVCVLNSPLKPILRATSTALTEAGIKYALLKEWEGASIPQNDVVEIMVLTSGQVILVFLIILAFFGCSILIFFCESYHKKIFWKSRALNRELEYLSPEEILENNLNHI